MAEHSMDAFLCAVALAVCLVVGIVVNCVWKRCFKGQCGRHKASHEEGPSIISVEPCERPLRASGGASPAAVFVTFGAHNPTTIYRASNLCSSERYAKVSSFDTPPSYEELFPSTPRCHTLTPLIEQPED